MSKDGYYGDFENAQQEAEEYAKWQQQQYEHEPEEEFTPPEADLCKSCGFAQWRHKDNHPCKQYKSNQEKPDDLPF